MWASRGLLLKKRAELNTRSITLYLAERASKWTKCGLNMAIWGFVPGAFKITCDYKGSTSFNFNVIQHHSTSKSIQIWFFHILVTDLSGDFQWSSLGKQWVKTARASSRNRAVRRWKITPGHWRGTWNELPKLGWKKWWPEKGSSRLFSVFLIVSDSISIRTE